MRHYAKAKCIAAILVAVHVSSATKADDSNVAVDAASVVAYIRSCEKPYGGFGPADNDFSDVSWTWFACRSLNLLDQPIPHPERIVAEIVDKKAHLRFSSPRLYHKAALCRMLGAEFAPARSSDAAQLARLHPEDNGGFAGHLRTNPKTKVHNTYYALWILSGGGDDVPRIREFGAKTPAWLASRQNPDGSWNNFPARDEPYTITAMDSRHSEWNTNPEIGHVHLTYCAVQAYALLDADVPNQEKAIAWLQACQGPGGGFRRAPERGEEDVWETWAAVTALKTLGAKPKHTERCLAFLNSLQNADGGFGDRPGWRSRLQSTCNALAALDALTGDARSAIRPKQVPAPEPVETPAADGLNIYSVYLHHLIRPEPGYIDFDHKAGVDVAGVVTIHRGRNQASHADALRAYARRQGYGMTVLENDLYYYGGLFYEGVGLGSHLACGVVWPPGEAASMDLKNTWRVFRIPFAAQIARARTVQQAGGLVYMNGVADHEAAERIVFDTAAEGKGGHDLMASIGWTDTVREHPWREKYLGRLPCMMDGVAHFSEPVKPLPVVYFARTLFVAPSNNYDDFRDAVQHNRVVTVFYHDRSLYYGAPQWVRYVKQQAAKWRGRWPVGPLNDNGQPRYPGPPR